MGRKKVVLWGVSLLIGLMLAGCAEYYGGYGDYDYPSYDDDYGYDYDHHREFGERHEGGEHHEGGGHHGSGGHGHR